LIDALLEHIEKRVPDCIIGVGHTKRGPYKEMVRAELQVRCKDTPTSRMLITFFEGRPPHHPPWAEIHDWDPMLLEKSVLKGLLEALRDAMPPGSRLFLEYSQEHVTRRLLERGAEPGDTPLGRLLVELGFEGVRDLYFPEGYREGGPKLLAFRKG